MTASSHARPACAKIILGLVFSLAFVGFAHAVDNNTTCRALEQDCEKRADLAAKVGSVVQKDQIAPPREDDLTMNYCYSAFDQAEKTGQWPAWRAMPATPCKK